MTRKDVERTLSEVEHARLVTEMYSGSRELHVQMIPGFDGTSFAVREHTWVPAVWTGFREILDNALDEMIGHRHGDTLIVNYDANETVFEVHDNGRGVPIHEIPQVGKGPAASIMMSNMRSGRNFEKREDVAGTNGLGASIVNMTAEWFELEVDRDGKNDKFGAKKLTQRWEEATRNGVPIHKTTGPHVIRGSKTRSGTRIRYKPSKKVYPILVLPEPFVRERMWDIAVTNPKIKVIYNGERLKPADSVDPVKATYFPNLPCASITVKDGTFQSQFYVVSGVDNVPSDTDISHSLVNRIPVFDGGKHLDTFKTLFYGVASDEIAKRVKAEAKIKDVTITRGMITPGVLIWNFTNMHAPRFDSQAKTHMVSNVAENVRNGFHESDVKSFLRRNPDWVASVVDRIIRALGNKADKEIARIEKKLSKQKIANLIDSTGTNRSESILFLFEGDSAKGLFPAVRDPKCHGYLPLLGKPGNVHKMTTAEIVADKVYNQIMSAVGLKTSEPVNFRRLRYGKVYIATDEDDDGMNIASLLVNFFYRGWPELFDPDRTPFLYRFQTPFIILRKASDVKYIYAHDYDEYIGNPKKYKGYNAYRAKGLGSLLEDHWTHALANPSLIPLTDDKNLKTTLDLIFDTKRADERKEWMK